jgi:hypothetical protein
MTNVQFTVGHNDFFPPLLTSNAKQGCCIMGSREIFIEGWSGRGEKLVTPCSAEIRKCRNMTHRTFSVSCRSAFMTWGLIIHWKKFVIYCHQYFNLRKKSSRGRLYLLLQPIPCICCIFVAQLLPHIDYWIYHTSSSVT